MLTAIAKVKSDQELIPKSRRTCFPHLCCKSQEKLWRLEFTMAAVSLSVSTVKPLGERVFVKVSAAEEKTAGGILLPDNAKEKPQVGEVVQVGPGKRNDDGSRQELEVKIGDKVLYSKYAGTDIKLGTDEYVLLSEKDILAIVS